MSEPRLPTNKNLGRAIRRLRQARNLSIDGMLACVLIFTGGTAALVPVVGATTAVWVMAVIAAAAIEVHWRCRQIGHHLREIKRLRSERAAIEAMRDG